jgi:hypothetical protein
MMASNEKPGPGHMGTLCASLRNSPQGALAFVRSGGLRIRPESCSCGRPARTPLSFCDWMLCVCRYARVAVRIIPVGPCSYYRTFSSSLWSLNESICGVRSACVFDCAGPGRFVDLAAGLARVAPVETATVFHGGWLLNLVSRVQAFSSPFRSSDPWRMWARSLIVQALPFAFLNERTACLGL